MTYWESQRVQRDARPVRPENELRLAQHDDAIRRYLGGVARAEERKRRAATSRRQPAVVVGVNAAGSYAAVDEAVTEAVLRGWRLRIVHVQPHQVSPSDVGPAVRRLLDEMYARACARAPEASIEAERLYGPVAHTLAAQSAAGLLVLGSRSAGTLADLVMGSVVTDVLGLATGSVALVRTAVPVGEPGEPRPVVVGVDGSPTALAAAAFAIEEARLRDAPLVAVHVAADALTSPAEGRDPLWTGPLHAAAEGVRGLTILRRRDDGPIPEALVEASATAAILVIGAAEGHHSYHGSTSQAVIRQARCPLFITRAAATEAVAS